MTKIRVLTISVICLVALNIVLIAGIFIGGISHHKEPKKIIIDKLELTASQVLEYEKSIKRHRNLIDDNEKQLFSLKQELHQTLISEDENIKQDLLKEISIIQLNIEQIHLAHFKEIKLICKPEQKEKFSSLINELPQLFNPRLKRKRP